MKTVYTSTALALILLSGAGVLFWNDYLESRRAEILPQQTIAKIKRDFQAKEKSLFGLNTEEIRQSRESQELIDPASFLPHAQNYPYPEVSAIYRYSLRCENKPKDIKNLALQKTLAWEEFLCGDRKTLPESFFKTRPFMHPLGNSFVALAAKVSGSPYHSSEWLSSHLKYTHVLENFSIPQKLAKDILPLTLKALFSGESLIEANSLIFFADAKGLPGTSTSYAAYDRKSWEDYLRGQYFSAQNGIGSQCIVQDGNMCWVKNKKRSEKENFRLALLFSLGLVVMVGTLLTQIVRRGRQQKRLAQHRTFVLQMLTHEIRTPATALQLSLETLRGDFDQLPSGSQEAFLRICDQTQKLGRVIEASGQYLISDTPSGSVKFKAKVISSINNCFETLLERYGDKIKVSLLTQDRSATFDRYWVELCLINLIENALAHGKPQVQVTLSYENNNLEVEVQDQGSLHANSIHELAIPFKKGASSQGLGLGLVLVQKITQAMGGELSLISRAPTTFPMKIKDV